MPKHWDLCRFKNFVSLANFPSTDENKIGLENIESGTGNFIETESDFEGNGVQYIENDIVYGKLRPYLRKVWLATNKGNAVGDFFVFRAKRSNASYVKWLMLSDGFTSETNGSTFGQKCPGCLRTLFFRCIIFCPLSPSSAPSLPISTPRPPRLMPA